jgi:uncharacterized membrane protein YphA (DoxX/SURF4 family)
VFTEITVRLVAAVWLVHGLSNKLLGGSARHLAIVQSVPGLDGIAGERMLALVGVGEVVIALWILSGWRPWLCAAAQTLVLLSMNVVELTFARSLLLWPAGLIPLNLAFLTLAWMAADSQVPLRLRARLRRHPVAITAHFHECLTLTYALPADVLRPLLSPGLELETAGGYGYVAVALVQAESLRPAGLPAAFGQDFFLAGYRVFTTFLPGRRSLGEGGAPGGRRLRGLRILRSDANRARMVVGGNLLTHYNYHRCTSSITATGHWMRVEVSTPDHGGDLQLTADLSNPALPAGSPFASVREARRFAGPLPFTFDFEEETNAIIAIQATRANWRPAPVSVEVERLSFFDQPCFRGCTPILAAAFHVSGVDYRWERGVRYALGDTGASPVNVKGPMPSAEGVPA